MKINSHRIYLPSLYSSDENITFIYLSYSSEYCLYFSSPSVTIPLVTSILRLTFSLPVASSKSVHFRPQISPLRTNGHNHHIVGFDNLKPIISSSLPNASVDQPFYDIGYTAAGLLHKSILDPNLPITQLELPIKVCVNK